MCLDGIRCACRVLLNNECTDYLQPYVVLSQGAAHVEESLLVDYVMSK